MRRKVLTSRTVRLGAWERSPRVLQADKDGERGLSLRHAFTARARLCCWHKAIKSLCIVCKAFRKISRLANERESLIKGENLLIFSTPGCSFTVTLNWPNYRLLGKKMGKTVGILSPLLVPALASGAEFGVSHRARIQPKLFFLLFLISYRVTSRLDQPPHWLSPQGQTWTKRGTKPQLKAPAPPRKTQNTRGPGQLSYL